VAQQTTTSILTPNLHRRTHTTPRRAVTPPTPHAMVIKNEQFIIMPEMANAVICPDTGKSLKHREIIIKFRYKIKWMRSTAN
jgi:hypothetical protein